MAFYKPEVNTEHIQQLLKVVQPSSDGMCALYVEYSL